jgi:prevent-host-death family protein
MTSIGTFDAKTHLSQLLQRVAKGERILITHRGKPVAMLVPPEADAERDTARIGREMLAYRDRAQRSLGRGSFRDRAHEGHRY